MFNSYLVSSSIGYIIFSFALSWSARICHKIERATERVKVKGRVWSQRLPFKCEETALCGISMHFLILSSVCRLLPVTPTATITCHPCCHLSLSLLSTPPLRSPPPIFTCHLSSSSSPSSGLSVVVSLLFKFTPHKFSPISTLPCPPSGGGYHGDS